MSHPTLLVRRDPLLLPRDHEIATYLSHEVWSAIFDSGPTRERVLRSDVLSIERDISHVVLNSDSADYWEPLLDNWIAWVLGVEIEFSLAASIFIHCMVDRYGDHNGLSSNAIDKGVIRYLKAKLDAIWRVTKPDPKIGWFRDVLPTAYDDLEDSTDRRVDLDTVDDGLVPPRAPRYKKWSAILQGRSFLQICNSWNTCLQNFFFLPDVPLFDTSPVDTIAPRRAACLTVVCHMRAVPKRICSSESWGSAVSCSGLAETILHIASPGALYQLDAPIMETRNIGLWRDILGEQLHAWTPKPVFLSLVPSDDPPKVYSGETPGGPKFVRYLNNDPSLIPSIGNCFALFFLHNESAFLHAWYDWLCPGLVVRGYPAATRWNPTRLFQAVKKYLFDPKTDLNTLNPTLHRIVANTLKHDRVLKKYTQGHFHQTFMYKSKKPQSKWTQQPPPAVPLTLRATASSHPKPSSSRSSSAMKTALQPLPLQTLPFSAPPAQKPHLSSPKHPSMAAGVCPKCAHLPEEETCIRLIYVERYPNAHQLDGCILTFATGKDRIAPLDIPALREQNSRARYVSPDELNFKRYKHRPDVYLRCGRDCTVFIDKDTNENIGGVVYEAFPEFILDMLLASHTRVTLNDSCKRGNKFQAHATGKMVPIGARIPQGGAVGDGYGPYAHMSAATNEAIDCLMAHALDGDLLLASVKPFNKHIEPELEVATQEAAITCFASTGINLYYCTDYGAPSHCDKDKAISLCAQLEKTGHRDKEGDFAYGSHAFYIETRSNCTWWFDSTKQHCPIMPAVLAGPTTSRTPTASRSRAAPAASSSDTTSTALDAQRAPSDHAAPPAPAVAVRSSKGMHSTIRQKDYKKAKHYRNVREQMPTCHRYWTRQAATHQ